MTAEASVKPLLKKLLRTLIGEYSYYYIYANTPSATDVTEENSKGSLRFGPVDQACISNSPDELIQAQANYAGSGCFAYACYQQQRIVALCFYWYGERYLSRNFWPLEANQAKLVQIICLPEMRGQGIASRLIIASSQQLQAQGFTRLYARIWHSNTPSLNAFIKAQWKPIARVISCNPLRLKKAMRLDLEP